MVEIIPLAITIFWKANFFLYLKYILKLVEKLELKIKNLKAKIVKQ